MDILTDSTAVARINAPIQHIDLTQWLFTLKDHEYQACSPAHIAAGATFNPEGKRVSINVEKLGNDLLVQHYVEDISTREHCRVHSLSDAFTPMGRTKLGITWELEVRAIDDNTCELLNHVQVLKTDELVAALQHAGITDLEPVKAGITQSVSAHNEEETPLFAKDIETKALQGIWHS